jgi:hypothetical protein
VDQPSISFVARFVLAWMSFFRILLDAPLHSGSLRTRAASTGVAGSVNASARKLLGAISRALCSAAFQQEGRSTFCNKTSRVLAIKMWALLHVWFTQDAARHCAISHGSNRL